jgi:hypothetical protein
MLENKNTQFIVCPKCDGSGHNIAGIACVNCGGLGFGSFLDGKFVYWGLSIGKATIKLRHLKKAITTFIDISFFTIGLFGLLSLGIMIFLYPENLDIFSFWRIKSAYILFFWIGLLAELYVYYKLTIEKEGHEKISSFINKKIKKIPNNWNELRKSKQKFDASKNFSENIHEYYKEFFPEY